MINIVLPVSRKDYLRAMFNCLAELEKPENTELLILVDGDKNLEKAIDKRLDSINFKRVRVVKYGNGPTKEIKDRRYRIADIHNVAKSLVIKPCEYVFLIEDDTTFPPRTLNKLLALMDSPTVGFTQGISMGRHKTPYIGAWKADELDSPSRITSLLPIGDARRADLITGIIKGEGGSESIEEIDAGGFYCALVRFELYREHHFEPFLDLGKAGLGCDFNLGLSICRKGYECLTDWSIQCDHIGDKGSVNLGNTKPVQVVFEKFGNRWEVSTRV